MRSSTFWSESPCFSYLYLIFQLLTVRRQTSDLATSHSFDQHIVHLSNIHRVLSHAPFREFAVKKREVREKLYDVIDRHESNTKLSEAESPYQHAWYLLLKSLERVGKDKLDLVMEMWFEKCVVIFFAFSVFLLSDVCVLSFGC